MNNEMETKRTQAAVRLKQLDDEFNAGCKAAGIPLEVHHELGCKMGRPLLLARHFVDPGQKNNAILLLDSLTVADLCDLQDDLSKKLRRVKARDRDAVERLLKEVAARIAAREPENELEKKQMPGDRFKEILQKMATIMQRMHQAIRADAAAKFGPGVEPPEEWFEAWCKERCPEYVPEWVLDFLGF